MSSTISHQAVTGLVEQLDQRWIDDAPTTYLPIILPLALPSPLHTINFFTTLHLVHDALSSPTHAPYFHETQSSARDTAIRGVVSLYLASDESWTAANLLSGDAWKQGKMDERTVAEHFEITVVREQEHETMKAIRVGSRWDKGVGAAQALVTLFAQVGERLSGRCVGEAVQALVEQCWGTTGRDSTAFAKDFVEQARLLVPTMDPSAPVHLLQDLAQRQKDMADLDLELPTPDQLSDIAPLALSIPVLLRYGVITLDGIDEARRTEMESRIKGPFDPTSTASVTQSSTTFVKLPQATLDHLSKLSISASTSIKEACVAADRSGDGEWKTRLSFRDLWRVFALLDDRLSKQGQGFVLGPNA